MLNIEKQKSRIENSKGKLKEKEKLLKEKEKKEFRNRINALGELFVKTQTSHLDHELLLGALLEIAEKSKIEKNLTEWREKFEENERSQRLTISKKGNAITISFKLSPDPIVKKKLKELNFKWNSFRCEYYGFGEKTVLNELLKNCECSIEMIE